MNSKTVIVSVVICIVALLATFQYGHAAQGPAAPTSKIGYVSIRTVLNDCQQQTRYQSQIVAKQNQTRAQLEALSKQISADEAELRTFKPGAADYLQRLQTLIENRSKLESQQEFFKQQRALEYKNWNEALYNATLKIVQDLAKERGLDMVLERTEPEFPMASLDELVAGFSTYKVLYAGGCVDLTREVIARLDAMGNLVP